MRVFIDTNLWAYRLAGGGHARPRGGDQHPGLDRTALRREVVHTDSTLALNAHQLAIIEQLSWFDALIVEAAIRSRCDVLFSEDLSHGSQIAGVTVCNPLHNGLADSNAKWPC